RDGQIRGRITEAATGAPVPGALITASSPALIGPEQTVTTDDDGNYLLPHLPPGVYTVKVSFAGVKPVTHKVLVEIGRTTPLDVKWSVEMAQAETTVVMEERHPTNPDSTQTGSVLSVDNESYLPTGRSYSNVILQVPGVVFTPAFADDPAIKGGRKAYNRYLIDGLDITDPVGRTATQLLAFDSIDSIQVVTAGFDAQYNVFGGLVNIISREGSDEFHGRASFYLTNDAINNRQQYGNTFYDQQQPFNDNPFSPSQTYRL